MTELLRHTLIKLNTVNWKLNENFLLWSWIILNRHSFLELHVWLPKNSTRWKKQWEAFRDQEPALPLGNWILVPGPLHSCSYKRCSVVFCAFQVPHRYFLSVIGYNDNTLAAEFGDEVQIWLLSLWLRYLLCQCVNLVPAGSEHLLYLRALGVCSVKWRWIYLDRRWVHGKGCL